MANGNGNGLTLTPPKIITICVAVTVAINSATLVLVGSLNEDTHDIRDDIQEIRTEVERRTSERYRSSDALRDFRIQDQKFDNVYFRFQRNEQNIEQCLDHIKNHPP